MLSSIKYTNQNKTDFYKVLAQRVDNYFKEKGISKNGDYRMTVKTIIMFSLYFAPYFLILSGVLSLYMMWFSCVVMGLGLAGIGMSIMHDANHGAYSSNKTWNKILGYSLNVIGGDSANWKIQHNVLHHTYTNVHGHDQDIRPRMNLRFTPAVKHNFLHYLQVFYAFIFYALQTIFWVGLKDFMNYFQYIKMNPVRETKGEKIMHFFSIIISKVIYLTYMLVIPALVLHLSWWQLFIGFATVHAVGGFILTVVFQLAHVVEGTEYPEPDTKGNITDEWAISQMLTTADFAPRNKLVTFYVGGLNFQIEHHLFHHICHVHYPQIAPIVKKTAEEYGIPYLVNDSFTAALVSHVRHLFKLGFNMPLEMG